MIRNLNNSTWTWRNSRLIDKVFPYQQHSVRGDIVVTIDVFENIFGLSIHTICSFFEILIRFPAHDCQPFLARSGCGKTSFGECTHRIDAGCESMLAYFMWSDFDFTFLMDLFESCVDSRRRSGKHCCRPADSLLEVSLITFYCSQRGTHNNKISFLTGPQRS